MIASRLVCWTLRDLTILEGRILVHGEEERSGSNYLLMEGTGRACSLYLLHAGDRNGAEYRRPEDWSFIRLRKLIQRRPAFSGHRRVG